MLEASPEVLLLGPGPSPTSAAVRQAQALPLLGHMDPAFLAVLAQVQQGLRRLFGTGNEVTLPIAGTGSAGMEAMLVNLLEPGERIVVGVHGVFGQRLAATARKLGGDVVEVRADFGAALDEDAVARAIAAGPTALCAVVHAETSTGVLQPLRGIAAAAQRHGALLLVDCVTSLGGVEFDLDELSIDAAFSATQKCLSAPPGLSPCTLSPRALQKVRSRRTPVPSFYFDSQLLVGYFGPDRIYHHTAPVSLIQALAAALDEIEREGLAARIRRHREVAAALVSGLEELGFRCLVPAGLRTPMLTTALLPEGVDDVSLRRELRSRSCIEIGGGLGPLSGKVVRIGLMGHGARREHVQTLLAALRGLLPARGGRRLG